VDSLVVVVTTPPYSNLTATAINLVEAAINNGIKLDGIFFYQDGVLNASKHHKMPSDEYQACEQWHRIHKEHRVPLNLCITAAEKRGLSDEVDESNAVSSIHEYFTVAGLGELAELTINAKRVIQL